MLCACKTKHHNYTLPAMAQWINTVSPALTYYCSYCGVNCSILETDYIYI